MSAESAKQIPFDFDSNGVTDWYELAAVMGVGVALLSFCATAYFIMRPSDEEQDPWSDPDRFD